MFNFGSAGVSKASKIVETPRSSMPQPSPRKNISQKMAIVNAHWSP